MAHRLFLALRPPLALREALLSVMGGIAGARWQDDDQLHLTLRFIGEVETPVANDLAEAFGQVRMRPFELTIRGVGHFERGGIPHTLWAGVAPSPELRKLRTKFERLCVAQGLEPERRVFAPHITLARLNASSGPVGPFLAEHERLAAGTWTVESFVLYESHLAPTGPRYEVATMYDLSVPA